MHPAEDPLFRDVDVEREALITLSGFFSFVILCFLTFNLFVDIVFSYILFPISFFDPHWKAILVVSVMLLTACVFLNYKNEASSIGIISGKYSIVVIWSAIGFLFGVAFATASYLFYGALILMAEVVSILLTYLS